MRYFLLLFVALLAACSSEFESQFIEGCESTGLDEDICECSFERLNEVYSDEELDRMLRTQHTPDQFYRTMIKAAAVCQNE